MKPMPTKVWFFHVFGMGMMCRWIDCTMFAVQTRSWLWTMMNVTFLLSCILPPLYFLFYYFTASGVGFFWKLKYKPETSYLKHSFKSPLTFFFLFPLIFLKNGREEGGYNTFLQSQLVFLWNIIDFSLQTSRDISEKARQRWGTSEIFSAHLVKE